MDQQGKVLRFGAWVILFALTAKLISAGHFAWFTDALKNPNIQSFLIYIETGRNVRFSPSLEENSHTLESPPPEKGEEAALPVFSAEDGDIAIYDTYGIAPELGSLLEQPLTWNLRMEAPTVLILHTHATESYTKTDENYRESSAYRTLDENYNMLSIGSRVADVLSQNGIAVIHDRELHDYPSYDGSYNHARETIGYYLERYPTIRLVLDLHRDASGDLNNQKRTVTVVDEEDVAQLMLVMGTDAGGLSHPNWRENLALGLKMQKTLEDLAPGITRPVLMRTQRFNQDLCSGALLVEVGTAGNSHPEALRAAEVLAEAIVVLSRGSAKPA